MIPGEISRTNGYLHKNARVGLHLTFNTAVKEDHTMTKVEVLQMDWYRKLLAEVQIEYDRLVDRQQVQAPALEQEKTGLQRQVQGWSQSLAKPDLDPHVRDDVENKYAAALRRIAEIEATIASRSAEVKQIQSVVDPEAVADRLNRLAEVLAGTNPSMGNIELAHHIDVINCYDDGRVVVRNCRLGAMADAVELFSVPDQSDIEKRPVSTSRKRMKVMPRRLAQRRIDSGEAPTGDLKARAIWATDPNRFANLDDRWFEEIVFHVPKKTSWAEKHAPCVATCRKMGFKEEQLAAHFKKTLPTIRRALRIAEETDDSLRALPRRLPRRRWHEDNALEVARRKAQGMGTGALVRHFGKSDVTIRKALDHAATITWQQDVSTLSET